MPLNGSNVSKEDPDQFWETVILVFVWVGPYLFHFALVPFDFELNIPHISKFVQEPPKVTEDYLFIRQHYSYDDAENFTFFFQRILSLHLLFLGIGFLVRLSVTPLIGFRFSAEQVEKLYNRKGFLLFFGSSIVLSYIVFIYSSPFVKPGEASIVKAIPHSLWGYVFISMILAQCFFMIYAFFTYSFKSISQYLK